MTEILFIYGSLLSFLTCMFIALYSLLSKNKVKYANLFIWFNFSVGLWSWGIFLINTISNYYLALILHKICYIGAIFLIPLFFNLIYKLTNIQKYRIFNFFIYFFAGFFLLTLPTDLFIKNLTNIRATNLLQSNPGIFYYLFFIYFSIFGTVCLGLLLKALKTAKGAYKNQLKFVFWAYAIEYTGGALYFASVLNLFPFLPPSDYMVAAGSIILVYAIIKHHLMDIDLAWRHMLKNLIYFLSLATSTTLAILGVINHNRMLGFIFFIVSLSLAYFNPIIDKFLYNIFLRKYKIIWDDLKKASDIKNIIYERNAIISILTSEISQVLDLSYAAYYNLDEPTQRYISDDNEYISLDNEIVKELTQTKCSLYLHDLKDLNLIQTFKDLGIELCYPIFFNKQDLIGILVYGHKKDNAVFNSEELELLAETIEKAEMQLNNIMRITHISANYAEEVLKRYKLTNQRVLLEETKRLSEIRDINLLCEHAKKVVQRLVNVKDVEIYLYDIENKQNYISVDDEQISINEENYLVKYLIQTNEIVAVKDLDKWAEESKSKDWEEAAKTAEKIKAQFIVPLTDKKMVGFFRVNNKLQSYEYTQDDFIFLYVVKNILEITIRNIYLNETAQRDPMTQLYNRNFLDVRLEEEIIQGVRECIPVSYIVIDADHFKRFNDEYSHKVGDEVLLAIVDCIKSEIRPTDVFCRFGGEEFALVCTNTDNQGALVIANRISQAFKENEKILKLNKLYNKKITVSIGVSTFHCKETKTKYTSQEVKEHCDVLKHESDIAMYKAKDEGRDRVCNGGEIMASLLMQY